MSKKLCVIQSAIATRSGYGDRSRDLIRAFIDKYKDEFEIELVPTPWGDTPWDALVAEKDMDLISRITKRLQPFKQWPIQPDLFIQITVPNEFVTPGKINIGVTAAIETDTCHPDFIRGCNRMNLTLVSSNHSKEVLSKTVIDQKTKEMVVLNKPVEVLFEGIRLDVFNKNNAEKDLADSPRLIEQMKNVGAFNFLFVGHWLKGDAGQDRKDIAMLIRTFTETFKDKKNPPGLILKTSAGGFSILDRNALITKIQQIRGATQARTRPPIHIVHGELTDQEMNALYSHPKVKAHISIFKGEGFGRPLLEATTSGKPVAASDFSGPQDFLHPEYSIKIPGALTVIHPSAADAKFLVEGGKWFTADYGWVMGIMKDLEKNYKKYLEKSRKQVKYTKDNFSIEKMADLLKTFLDPFINKIPTQVPLVLPKLTKVKK